MKTPIPCVTPVFTREELPLVVGRALSSVGEKLHVMHKNGINAAYFDGHAASIKHDMLMKIQRSPHLIRKHFDPFNN